MFGSIARRYDLANHILSCGADFYWRNCAAQIVANWKPKEIIDLATGTGDLALAIQRKLPEARIIGVDFLPEMLEIANRKGLRQTIVADAMKLPSADSSFDCITEAYAYLGESIEEFPSGEGMIRLLEANGFRNATARPLSSGIVTIYTAEKRPMP
jgi:ubiquinone/menaquinone biosynthesis C-methylase UbiE